MKPSIVIILSSILLLVGCFGKDSTDSLDINNINKELKEEGSMTVGDNLPVSRAIGAKMLALAFNDINTIDSMDREITFTDTSPEQWFDKYINVVYIQGIMNGSDNLFMPDSPITLQHAQNILNTVDENNSIRLQITSENRDMPISYALWSNLYMQMLDNMSGDSNIEEYFGIKQSNYVVLATEEDSPMLQGGIIITDKGPLVSEGIINHSFVDKEITILEKEGEVIAILSVNSIEPTIRNAFVVENDRNSITIFSGGVERTYLMDNNFGDISGQIIDITIREGNILHAHIHENIIDNTVIKRVSCNFVELKGKGRIPLSNEFKVYSIIDNNVRWRQPRNLIVGTDIATFVMNEDEIVAAIINKIPDNNNIRVVIGTTGFTSLIHPEVEITATSNFVVRGYNETREYEAFEVVRFKENEHLFGNDRVYIEVDWGGMIQINSISRNWPNNDSPMYRGIIEIAREDEGFTIINELLIEEYLYAVVPSEMPSTYGIEVSMVQAVAARSFAHNQILDNKFHMYGANVDDSVMSQVYNNIPENLVSIQAVDNTRGLHITFEDNVINANFFSTSAGVTANQGEVWAGDLNRFPTESRPYLQFGKHYRGESFGDLSIEENAAAFFKENNIDSHDNISPWFRWSVEMAVEQVTASINENLSTIYESNPFLVKTLQENGIFRSRPVNTIGNLVNIEALTRGEAGNIMELKITGTENTILVRTEYNIRRLIAPTNYIEGADDVILRRMDGTALINYSIMPSSFYTIERLTNGDGDIITVRFLGGGNGHGVGMSQYAVKSKISNGYNFIEVIESFYPGAQVKEIK